MAKSRIESIVEQYLKMPSNYAILINGARGAGKTFFVKTKIVALIKRIETQHNFSKKYKPVYISLYGLKSIDDVFTLLALELLPFLKRKESKISVGLSKIIARGLLNFKGLGDIDEYIKDTHQLTKATIDTRNFVLLFDDLDRLSPELKINDLIGFINSLVEHDNNKVIIIADDSKLKKTEDNTAIYNEVKEKTIGTVIEYTFDFSSTYDDIIKEKFKKSGDNELYKALKDYKSDVLKVFELANSANLRILIYFLQHFRIIFPSLYNEFKLDDENLPEVNRLNFVYIIRLTAILSIEFKKGMISYVDGKGIEFQKEINDIRYSNFLKEMFEENAARSNSGNQETPVSKSYKEIFIEMYFAKIDYVFLQSIYSFITGGDELDVELLQKEIHQKLSKELQNDPPHIIVLNKLSYDQCFDLKNSELKSLTAQMYNYAKKGAYKLEMYLTVFSFIERFNTIFNYNLEDVRDTLISSVNKNMEKFEYSFHLSTHYRPEEDRPHYEDLKKIYQAIASVNEKIREQTQQIDYLSLFQNFKEDRQSFYGKMLSDFYHKPIFNSWNLEVFYKYFLTLTNTEIIAFRRFINKRYEYPGRHLISEADFFKNFLIKLKKIYKPESSMRDYVLLPLVLEIEQVLKKMASNSPDSNT